MDYLRSKNQPDQVPYNCCTTLHVPILHPAAPIAPSWCVATPPPLCPWPRCKPLTLGVPSRCTQSQGIGRSACSLQRSRSVGSLVRERAPSFLFTPPPPHQSPRTRVLMHWPNMWRCTLLALSSPMLPSPHSSCSPSMGLLPIHRYSGPKTSSVLPRLCDLSSPSSSSSSSSSSFLPSFLPRTSTYTSASAWKPWVPRWRVLVASRHTHS